MRSRGSQFDVPIRSRRTLVWVTSTPHFSQIRHGVSGACTYRTGTRNLLPAKDTGAEKAVTFWFERTVVDVSGFLTSPKDHERIMSGEARQF